MCSLDTQYLGRRSQSASNSAPHTPNPTKSVSTGLYLTRLCFTVGLVGEERRCPRSELGQVRLQATRLADRMQFIPRLSCIFDLGGHARILARRHRWFSSALQTVAGISCSLAGLVTNRLKTRREMQKPHLAPPLHLLPADDAPQEFFGGSSFLSPCHQALPAAPISMGLSEHVKAINSQVTVI